jgi:protein-disulfide isomerase
MRKSLAGYLSVLFVGLVLGVLGTAAYYSGKSATEKVADPVVAEVKGEAIPASQAFKENKRRIFELEEALFKLKRQSLDDYLENRLLSEESKKKNIAVDRLIMNEVGNEAGPVSDKEVESFLAEKGIPAETAEKKNEVREYLKFRKSMEKRHAYLAQLKNQAGVKVYLDAPAAPRVKVDVDGYPSWGNASAPITLVEFADFECPFCQRTVATLERLKETYGPDKLRVVFRDLPIDTHERAVPAALAAHCANEQGKFWEYHKTLYENQTALGDQNLKDYAKKIGLDAEPFAQCFDSKKFASLVEKGKREADALGLDSTPTFIVNGIIVPGAQPYEVLKEKIDALLSQNT